nr:unnamed protein product [Digitaria exilis]
MERERKKGAYRSGGVGEEGGAGEADALDRRLSPPRERPFGGAVAAGASPHHCSPSHSFPSPAAAYTTIIPFSLHSASPPVIRSLPLSSLWPCVLVPDRPDSLTKLEV